MYPPWLQGVFVSFLLCFCNTEVLSLVSKRWAQYRVSVKVVMLLN
jgi:hypothetical protein